MKNRFEKEHLIVEKMWDRNWRLLVCFEFELEAEQPGAVPTHIACYIGSCWGFRIEKSASLLDCLNY